MRSRWFLLIALAGCAAHTDDTTAAKTAALRTRLAKEAEALYAEDTSIRIDPEIMRRCKLPTAHFDFDSDHVELRDSPALDMLARCFTTGPLAGRELLLVGHADQRGELLYNFALGHRRAGSVATYLGLSGLDYNQMITTSLGELEATGENKDGWADDRYVELLLAE